jgi:tRNA (uracil-5-)-methyltransferase TRM9
VQKKIVAKLNQLNKNFYQNVADDFSDSRQYFWQGWQKIPYFLKKNIKSSKKIQILDIACGNARFAQFLKEQNLNFHYLGLDNSVKLLKIAQEKIDSGKINGQVINFDLIANYLKNKKINWPVDQKFDLIVAFGLSHHLPSFELRLEFFQSLNNLLADDGLLIISNWQFANDQRFQKNILNWQKIKKNSKINIFQKIKLKKLLKNLENNDYLLDWRKKEKTSTKKELIRYCHYLDNQTSNNLFKKAGFQILDQFLADGKSQQLNNYFVLKKAN